MRVKHIKDGKVTVSEAKEIYKKMVLNQMNIIFT